MKHYRVQNVQILEHNRSRLDVQYFYNEQDKRQNNNAHNMLKIQISVT